MCEPSADFFPTYISFSLRCKHHQILVYENSRRTSFSSHWDPPAWNGIITTIHPSLTLYDGKRLLLSTNNIATLRHHHHRSQWLAPGVPRLRIEQTEPHQHRRGHRWGREGTWAEPTGRFVHEPLVFGLFNVLHHIVQTSDWSTRSRSWNCSRGPCRLCTDLEWAHVEVPAALCPWRVCYSGAKFSNIWVLRVNFFRAYSILLFVSEALAMRS